MSVSYCAIINGIKVPKFLPTDSKWRNYNFIVGTKKTRSWDHAVFLHEKTGLSIVLFSHEEDVCEVLKV